MKKGIIDFLGWIIIIALIFMAGVSIFFFIFYYVPGTKCSDKQRQELTFLTEKISSMAKYTEITNFTIYGCVKEVKANVIDNEVSELCFEFEKVLFLPEEEVCLKNLRFDLSRIGGKIKVPGVYEIMIDKTEIIRKVIFLRKVG
jgi:hypothetical protein